MPRKPVVSRADSVVQVSVRMPGWLKNRIAVEAAENGESINRWAAGVLLRAVEAGEGFPEAPPAQTPLPSPDHVLRAYLSGEDLIEPCGKVAPCERVSHGVTVVDNMTFCNFCRIRVE